MDNKLEVLIQLFSNLTDEQKAKFFSSLNVNSTSKTTTHKNQTKEAFLASNTKVVSCPFCGSKHLVKNGKKDGKQRFMCRDCHHTFGYTENTILKGSHISMSTLELYINCMVEKRSLRETAQICGISVPTSFAWRHRILDVLINMENSVTLNGIVESDETFVSISYKGNHSKSNFTMPRRSHKRGEKASRRGLSREKACLSCSVNHNGLSIGAYSNLGKPQWTDINSVINNRIEEGSIFVTDSYRGYNRISHDMNLNHIAIESGKYTNGIFNIQLINNYHRRFKEMINNTFNGVSTKYINNYIAYNNLINFSKGSKSEKEQIIRDFVFTTKEVKSIRVAV